MLVLSAKDGDTIAIGDSVVLTCVRTSQDSVRLGFNAPKEIAIVRSNAIKKTPCQHTGPLEADGGPPGMPELAPTVRVDDWHHKEGTPPDLAVIGITPSKPR